MSAKKIVVIVLSSALALILGFCTFWVINNYDAIEYAMSGSALYTKTDLEKAYEDGYNSAGFDVKDLNDQIADLRNKLETKTAEYNKAKANYEEYLKKFNDLATLSEKEKAELYATISALNSEITGLEKDIVNLETTLETYKEFQAQLEAENKVIATFEYDGAVILLQNYEKGAKLQDVVVPENTDEITFNGWTVNGQAVNISDYTINESTTFVADLSYHYTVNFMVDDTLYNSQTTSNGAITLPENPTKSGCTFKGWSLDGETIIDVQLSDITSSMNYIAVFEFLEKYNALELIEQDVVYDASNVFNYKGNTYYSSSSGQYIYDKNSMSWTLLNWKTPGYMYGYSMWTDGKNLYGCCDEKSYFLDDEASTWEFKNFDHEGIVLLYEAKYPDGRNIWTDGNNIYLDVSLYSYFGYFEYASFILDVENSKWKSMDWGENQAFSVYGNKLQVGDMLYCFYDKIIAFFDKESCTWVELSSNSNLASGTVWTDGENIYSSYGDKHYVLNKSTFDWNEKTWDGLEKFYASDVWTDGENYYMSDDGKTYKFVLK